jgi:hypothetical protein
MIREHMKAMGMVANWSAIKTIRAALVRAKEQGSTVPFQHSSTEFMVQSATHPDVDHIVTILRGVSALCTCRARSTNHVCWHIVKCLMLQGMSETVLVSQLGSKWGSKDGGYAALWTSEPYASQILPVTDSCQTCATATEAQEPTHCPRPAGAARAIACPEGIHQMVDLILSDGDPTPGSKECDGLLQCLHIYRETQLKKKAVQNAPSLLLSNPKAPPSMSLQRLLPSGERHKRPGAHKTVPTSRTTLVTANKCGTTLSRGGGLPFMPKKTAPKKPPNVAAEVDLAALKAAEKAGKMAGKPTPASHGSGKPLPTAEPLASLSQSQPARQVLNLFNAPSQQCHAQVPGSLTPLAATASLPATCSALDVRHVPPSLYFPGLSQASAASFAPAMLPPCNPPWPQNPGTPVITPTADPATLYRLMLLQCLRNAAAYTAPPDQ